MKVSAPAWLCLLPVLGGCAGTAGLGPVLAAAAEAPEDMGLRLTFAGETLVGAAAGLSSHRLPTPVRSAIDGIAPGGELQFQGREWGPAGSGYRIDKRYRDDGEESFRSMLVAEDGSVIERRHSVPLPKVPAAVLTTAMRVGRDVRRCDIRSDSASETGWHVVVVDGAGHTFALELSLDAGVRSCHRIVATQTAIATPR